MQTTPITKSTLLENFYRSTDNGIRTPKANAPKQWLKEKKLSIESTGASFNSGQYHHRKAQTFKEALEAIGLLKRSNAATNAGQIPYTSFGKSSILFPLRNQHKEIVNFYAMNIEKNKNKNVYLNEEGIYPCYPDQYTKTLYITDTLLDAATLLESKTLDNREAVMALHDGIVKPQHQQAIEHLKELTQVIYIELKKTDKP